MSPVRQYPYADVHVEDHRAERPYQPGIGVEGLDRIAVDIKGQNQCRGKCGGNPALTDDIAVFRAVASPGNLVLSVAIAPCNST